MRRTADDEHFSGFVEADIVFFKHHGWKEPVEFMHHCSTKWGLFLMSLKSLVETGKGDPWPNDIQISNSRRAIADQFDRLIRLLDRS